MTHEKSSYTPEKVRQELPVPAREIRESRRDGMVFQSSHEIYVFDGKDIWKVADRKEKHAIRIITIAVNSGLLYDSVIYGYYGTDREEKTVIRETLSNRTVSEQTGTSYVMVSHNGKLYHTFVKFHYVTPEVPAHQSRIYETLSNRIVVDREMKHPDGYGSVYCMVSHEGKLFDGDGAGRIHDTLANVVVAERGSSISALVSHTGKLYDAGYDGRIYETLTGGEIVKRRGRVHHMVSHGGKLYDCSCGENSEWGEVYETFSSRQIIKRNSQLDIAFCNGKLYDGSKDGLFETGQKGPIFHSKSFIGNMIPVDMQTLEKYLKVARKVS